MKSKFMRILALILVMSSLLSMFTVFAYANETDGSETEGEPENNTQESSFTLMYNRTFDEGWNVFNGLELNDQGTTGHTKFEIDYEETVDYNVNYFMRVELDSSDNDFVQMNCGAKANVGAVFEFDMKSDDICNFSNVLHFGTKGGASADRSNYDLIKVVDNEVYFMFNKDQGFEGGSTEPAFTLTNDWMRVQIVFDFTYERNPILETDTDEDKLAKEAENDKWFQMYIYYSSADGSSDRVLWSGAPLTLPAKNGKGIQLFRFQSTGSDKAENYGSSICFDNMKYYDGTNVITAITEDMGYGNLVNRDYAKTIDIIGSAGTADDLTAALCMKVGVDYCYINKAKTPIAVAADGTVFGAPVKVNGNVMIPINKVLEYLEYDYYLHPDGSQIDISTGLTATSIYIGKDVAFVGSGDEMTRTQLSAAPAYVTDEDGNSYFAIALNDVDDIFPGFFGDYDDMGFIAVSNYNDILDREINSATMVSIMKEFIYDYFTGDEIYEDVKNNTDGFKHPYIIANGDQLEELYNEYQNLNARMQNGEIEEGSDDYWMWVHYQRIVDTGNRYYRYYAKTDANGTYDTFAGLEPDPYDENGNNLRGTMSLDQNYLDAYGYDIGGRSDIANRTNYLEGMTFAYVLTKDVKYLKLCYEIALRLGEWTHWGPGHFLNCADSSNDFAIYYDWTYNGYEALKDAGEKRYDDEGNEIGTYEVEVLAEILARQGVHEGYLSTTKNYDHISPVVGVGGGSYSERVNNWAAVCVSGMTLASLSILNDAGEEYTEEAKYILSENFKSLVTLGLDIYAPDGSYIEGPGYWNYGTNNFFRLCAALDSAAGTNYGLMDTWGMDTTCYYACHTEDNDGAYFPFHDGHVGSQDTSYFFYVADYFNDGTLYDVRLNQIDGNVKWATIIDMIYYPRNIKIEGDDIQLDYYSDNIDLFATRSSWERGALFASMIGGNNNVTHGQIDAGDFVYHNGGNIWIYDLGTENYNCAGFWPNATRYRYYVMKPEGNNTVAITTDPSGVPYGQVLDSVADAYAWGSNEHGSFVTYDMGGALGNSVKWERGMMLTNDRKTTVIQDQIRLGSMQTVYWFAHYSLSHVDKVEITPDGRTAYMKEYIGTDEHGEKMYQTLRLSIVSATKSLKFEVMDCYTFIHNTGNNATYSPDQVLELGSVAERSRSNYRKLAICNGIDTTFELAVVIELIDTETIGTSNELEVGYNFVNMRDWTPYEDTRGIKIDDSNTILRRGVPNIEKHLVQSISKIEAMNRQGTLYTTKIKDFYRAITDAHYAVRMIGTDLSAEYNAQAAAVKTYRDGFEAYRTEINKLQKVQVSFVDKLMGL